MKTLGVALFAAVLAFGLAPARAEEADKAADELKALDAKLTEAFKKHDVKALEEHAADNMLVIDPVGRVHDKKQYFEHLNKGAPKIDELKEDDVKVRVFGDTGIVTGLLTIKGMVKDRDISGEYRWTRVYHKKKGGDWQVVSEQHTYVLPPEKPK
jgi:ketosteroid isomerase-like protein